VTELSLLLYPQTAPLYPEGDGVAFAGVCAEVREMGSSCPSRTEDAMSVYQRDAEAGRPETEDRPAFRVVRRGYDREEVDGYLAQLVARLGEAVDQYAKAEQARAELQREVLSLREGSPSFEQLGGEAAALLQEAGRSAEQLVENARRRADTITEKAQQQAEQMRRSVEDEAQKVLEQAREVAEQIRRDVEQERDDLGRVHGEISGLLERTRKQRDQALLSPGGADAKAEPAADAKPGRQAEPAQPAKVGEPE
jgi:DivIVA domain-containing protein